MQAGIVLTNSITAHIMILTADFLELRIDDAKALLYGKWLRNVTNEEYKAGLQQLYRLILKYNIRLWVQNSEQLLPRDVADQKWASEEFALLLTQSSIEKLAIVIPKTSPHYTILCSLREKAYRIFGKAKLVELFETNEDALRWLTPYQLRYSLPANHIQPL